MTKNAIILAAGKSNRFAPFTYEKPKGLFIVKGEVLIERQIEQLIESGIKDIYVVIGYMKEKFFYLERKYSEVTLIINNTFGKYGNIYSLYVARQYLANTFICCADHYFTKNPFIDDNELNLSYRACSYLEGNFREFGVDCSDADIITDCYIGGSDGEAMIGHAYFNEKFSNKFRQLLEEEINNFGVVNMFWEDYYATHIKDLTLFKKEFGNDEIFEFEDIDDLRQFDSDFLLNVDSEIVENICKTLKCHPNEISNIDIIKAGLTNASFKFTVENTEYVYRHPGGTADSLIDRRTEVYTQNQAKKYELDDSLIYISPEGWKISYFIQNIIPCDIINNETHLKQCMDALHKTHEIPISDDVKLFDNVVEAKRLINLACATKGNLFKEFEEMISKIDQVDEFVKAEREKYGINLTVCHNDVYEPNFISTSDDDFYLIDWEYSGVNDPVNDVACIFTRYEYDDSIRDMLLKAYYGRELTPLEHRHAMAQAVLSAFYWISWGLFKGSVGEEDGFFFLPAFRYVLDNVDEVIESYKEL
ncbi:MAG: choline-phosphate cytidylyltransferase [Methanobrevibacter thaueri]|nr:choline-phosphate cytidylyltransferase [Methanobrevibacter thaueri]